jgi:hypothetical protein
MSDLRSNGAEALTGYMHPAYAGSLAEFGRPRRLPRCGGWILERQIPRFPYCDAMGFYPLFFCRDWSQLAADLEGVGTELVSVAVVTDPFGEYDPAYLRQCFRDVVIPFKEHYVVDLRRPANSFVSRNRRKKARRAFKEVWVEECREPTQFIEEWVALYATLVEKHKIAGIKAFSRTAFAKQLTIPGLVMLRAVHQGITVGATLWFVQGEVGYGHLAAFSKVGYELRASYALDWFAVEYFSDKVRWLDLGAGAGMANDSTNGLSLYKRGWSTGTRTVYFCGRIFDHQRYAEIVKAKDIPATSYFPAYRKGEFT